MMSLKYRALRKGLFNFILLYLMCSLASTAIAAKGSHSKEPDLFEMADQFDQVSKQDLQAVIDRANDCTRARNFACSEEHLRKAAKLVSDSSDRQLVKTATLNLQAEKKRVQEEAEAKAARERQIALAEERAAKERKAERRRQEEEAYAESRRNAAPAGKQMLDHFTAGLNSFSTELNQSNQQTQQLYAQAVRNQQERDRQAQAEANRKAAAEDERRREEARYQRLAQDEARERENQRRANAERAAEQGRRDREAKQQQERARQANNYNSGSTGYAANSAGQSGSSSTSKNLVAERCIFTYKAGGSSEESEALASEYALKYALVKNGGPDHKVIISTKVTSCKTDKIYGHTCTAITEYEADIGGSWVPEEKRFRGRCDGGPGAAVSR